MSDTLASLRRKMTGDGDLKSVVRSMKALAAHLSRVLGARWMNLPAHDAQHLLLSAASLSILGYEHTSDDPTIVLWNDDHHIHDHTPA